MTRQIPSIFSLKSMSAEKINKLCIGYEFLNKNIMTNFLK